jgi:AcrR family transcriptional regulator
MPTRTRRRTREEQRAATRAKLIAAAERLFIKKGFAGTSVEEIADAAGFTRGAFYSNFEDKDDIFIALLDDKLERRIAEVSAILESAGSLDDAFSTIIRSNETRGVASTTVLNTEFWLYAMRNPKVRTKLAEHQRAERRAYERAIHAVFSGVELEAPGDAHDIALMLVALDIGASRINMVDPDDVGGDFFFRALLQLFEAGQALARERTKT